MAAASNRIHLGCYGAASGVLHEPAVEDLADLGTARGADDIAVLGAHDASFQSQPLGLAPMGALPRFAVKHPYSTAAASFLKTYRFQGIRTRSGR